MKLSISLHAAEIEFIDAYARQRGVPSRSAVVRRAVELLRASELGAAYADAWSEWDRSGENAVWEPTVGDGLATPS